MSGDGRDGARLLLAFLSFVGACADVLLSGDFPRHVRSSPMDAGRGLWAWHCGGFLGYPDHSRPVGVRPSLRLVP